jgi:NAD(P)-dependent dehydrogenase (short-subunit alcohol dehydrogenase family)
MSFESVRNAANQVKGLFPDGIDVLSNNAGIMMFEESASTDGYDCQMATNHLAHFLLTKELFPLLKKKSLSNEVRIVNHSSEARRNTKLDKKYYEKFTTPGSLGGNGIGAKVTRYNQTKYANTVFTNALQDKVKEKSLNIKAYCAHPGLAATQLQVSTAKNSGFGLMTCVLNILFAGAAGAPQSQEDGTVGLLRCMVEPNLPTGGVYGPANSYWTSGPAIHNYPDVAAPTADLMEEKQKLWELSEAACGIFTIE